MASDAAGAGRVLQPIRVKQKHQNLQQFFATKTLTTMTFTKSRENLLHGRTRNTWIVVLLVEVGYQYVSCKVADGITSSQ